jgi:DNA repair photolyase
MVRERVVIAKNYICPSKIPGVDFAVNPYVGCPHKCMYCYAERVMRHAPHEEEWGDFVDVKRCAAPIKLARLRGKRVILGTATDPYNPYEKKYGVTRRILEQLASAECCVGITTKSFLVVRDIDLLKSMPYVQVAISMNSTDDRFRAAVEPYASSVGKKIEALRRLCSAGVKTVLFMSPIFPVISDVARIIEAVRDCAGEFWFEGLKLRDPYKPRVLDFIKRAYPECAETYRQIYVRGDTSYWRGLSQMIDDFFISDPTAQYSKFLSW